MYSSVPLLENKLGVGGEKIASEKLKWRQQETKTSLPKIKSKTLWASSGKDIAEDWVLPHLSIATAELVTSAAVNKRKSHRWLGKGDGGKGGQSAQTLLFSVPPTHPCITICHSISLAQ